MILSYLHDFISLDPSKAITVEPREVVINQTQEATFNCTAYGIPTPNITWIKVSDGSVVNSTGDIQITNTDLKLLTRECLAQLSYDPRYFSTIYAVQDIENLRIALVLQTIQLLFH